MKVKISFNGKLQVFRKTDYKTQVCVKQQDTKLTLCGDLCPLFEEPKPLYVSSVGDDDIGTGIKTCFGVLEIEDGFIDERPTEPLSPDAESLPSISE